MSISRKLFVRAAMTLGVGSLLAVGVAVYHGADPAVAGTQHRQAVTASGQNTVTTVAMAPTARGATLVVCVGADVAIDAITDDAGSTYTLVQAVSNSSRAGTLSVYEAPLLSKSVRTISLQHGWGNVDVAVSEYAGLRSGHDRATGRDAGYDTGAAWSSGPTTLTRRSGELVVGCAFDVYAAAEPATFSPGQAFTARATARGVFLEDRTVTRAGMYTASGTRLPADRRNVVAAVITFPTKRAVTPVTPVPPPDPTTAPTTAAIATTVPATTGPTTTATATTTATTAATSTTIGATTTSSTTPAASTTVASATTTTTNAPTTTTTVPPPPSGPVQLLFSDVASGPTTGGPDGLGVPIAIFGKGFGSSRGASTVTIGGVEVARYLSWGHGNAHNHDLDMIVVQPGPSVQGGAVVMTVDGVSTSGGASFAVDAAAHIFEVALGGSDANSCRWGQACATILRAAGVSGPGDIILVRAGQYAESEIWVRGDQGMSGAPGRQKVIKAAPAEEVVLTNADRPFIIDADNVTVAGLVFRNGKSIGVPDVGLPGHHGDQFVDNTFAGLIAWSALDTHGDGHLLAGNVCEVTGSTVGTQGHCYYVSYGVGTQLRYNTGSGAPGYGIHVFDQQRSAQDFRRVIGNMLIEGNVLRGSTERSGLIIAMNDEGGAGNIIDGVIVRGNTFAANSHLGVVVSGHVRNVTITGNTFDENGRQGVHIAAGVTGVAVVGNTIVQSENTNCRNDCTWYATAHVEVEPSANVDVRGNTYRPGSPILIGAVDPAPH